MDLAIGKDIYLSFWAGRLGGDFFMQCREEKKRCLKVTPKVRVLESKKLFVLSTRQPITI